MISQKLILLLVAWNVNTLQFSERSKSFSKVNGCIYGNGFVDDYTGQHSKSGRHFFSGFHIIQGCWIQINSPNVWIGSTFQDITNS